MSTSPPGPPIPPTGRSNPPCRHWFRSRCKFPIREVATSFTSTRHAGQAQEALYKVTSRSNRGQYRRRTSDCPPRQPVPPARLPWPLTFRAPTLPGTTSQTMCYERRIWPICPGAAGWIESDSILHASEGRETRPGPDGASRSSSGLGTQIPLTTSEKRKE